MPGCKSWTYHTIAVKGAHLCYLHSSSEGSTSRPGVISGTPTGPPGPPAPPLPPTPSAPPAPPRRARSHPSTRARPRHIPARVDRVDHRIAPVTLLVSHNVPPTVRFVIPPRRLFVLVLGCYAWLLCSADRPPRPASKLDLGAYRCTTSRSCGHRNPR